MVTEEGMGRTYAGAGTERIDAEYDAYLDVEHQGEYGPVVGGTRAQSARAAAGSKRAAREREREGGRGRIGRNSEAGLCGCGVRAMVSKSSARGQLWGDVQGRDEARRHQAIGGGVEWVSGCGAGGTGEGTHSCWKSPV